MRGARLPRAVGHDRSRKGCNMEPSKVAEEQNTEVREGDARQELDGSTELTGLPLSLNELDAASGGAAGAGTVEIDGQVLEVLPNAMFQVRLDDGSEILCSIWGRLRMNYVRIFAGDRVRVQINPHDSSRGLIVFRCKQQ